MKRLIVTVGLCLALVAARGSVSAQTTTENLTATDGNASTLGTGDASASPGTVTRGGKGASLLGPDGTYNAVEVAPPSVSVSGDTSVLHHRQNPLPPRRRRPLTPRRSLTRR